MNKPMIYEPKSTGTDIPRDIRDRFADILNVKDYGAIGDGNTNDTQAFKNAKSAANTKNTVVYVPYGTYKITENIVDINANAHTFLTDGHVTITGGGSVNVLDLSKEITTLMGKFDDNGKLKISVISLTNLEDNLHDINILFDLNGNVSRKLSDRLKDCVSLKDFGAKGDGITDDTQAWNAFQTIQSLKFIPAGTYLINGEKYIFTCGIYGNGIFDNTIGYWKQVQLSYEKIGNSILRHQHEYTATTVNKVADVEDSTIKIQTKVEYNNDDPKETAAFTKVIGGYFEGIGEGAYRWDTESKTGNFTVLGASAYNRFIGNFGMTAITGRVSDAPEVSTSTYDAAVYNINGTDYTANDKYSRPWVWDSTTNSGDAVGIGYGASKSCAGFFQTIRKAKHENGGYNIGIETYVHKSSDLDKNAPNSEKYVYRTKKFYYTVTVPASIDGPAKTKTLWGYIATDPVEVNNNNVYYIYDKNNNIIGSVGQDANGNPVPVMFDTTNPDVNYVALSNIIDINSINLEINNTITPIISPTETASTSISTEEPSSEVAPKDSEEYDDSSQQLTVFSNPHYVPVNYITYPNTDGWGKEFKSWSAGYHCTSKGESSPVTAGILIDGNGCWNGIVVGSSLFNINKIPGTYGTVGLSFAAWRRDSSVSGVTGAYGDVCIKYGSVGRWHHYYKEGCSIHAGNTVIEHHSAPVSLTLRTNYENQTALYLQRGATYDRSDTEDIHTIGRLATGRVHLEGSIYKDYVVLDSNKGFIYFKVNGDIEDNSETVNKDFVYVLKHDTFAPNAITTGGSYASTDVSLGRAGNKWSQLYADTGTINTSDERTKQNIDNIPDEVLDVWGTINWKQYKIKSAVTLKGDNARTHTGIIAQAIKTAFDNANIDITRYGLLCYDEWEDEYADIEVVDSKVTVDAPEQTHTEHVLVKPAGSLYSIRYEEALAMEAAYQRRRADRLEARIALIENTLGISNE